jgi:hypothetical protein
LVITFSMAPEETGITGGNGVEGAHRDEVLGHSISRHSGACMMRTVQK